MENATVTDIKEKDSHILSVDDLVMEIGKQHVEKMSFEKHVSLLKKSKVVPPQPPANKGKVDESALISSNKLYEERNRNLTDEVVVYRNKFSKSETSNKELIEKLEVANTKLDSANKRETALKAKITRLEKKAKSVNKK
jgi:hypothetical protein